MKKIELLFTILAIIISTNIYAISNYEKGDSLYVWAQKGLQLRAEPSFDSQNINLIKYGELVISLDNKSFYPFEHRPDEISVIEIPSKYINNKKSPSLSLKGNWCKVNYNGSEGYVFDAYLSTLKIIKHGEGPKKYLDRNFGIIDTLFFQQNEGGQELKISKLVYNNGILFKGLRGVSYGSETFIFPFSFEEAYLLFVSNNINNDDPYYNLVESDQKRAFFSGAMDNIILTKVNGFVIIENEWGN